MYSDVIKKYKNKKEESSSEDEEDEDGEENVFSSEEDTEGYVSSDEDEEVSEHESDKEFIKDGTPSVEAVDDEEEEEEFDSSSEEEEELLIYEDPLLNEEEEIIAKEEKTDIVLDPDTNLNIRNPELLDCKNKPKLLNWPPTYEPGISIFVGSQRSGKTFAAYDLAVKQANENAVNSISIFCPGGSRKRWAALRNDTGIEHKIYEYNIEKVLEATLKYQNDHPGDLKLLLIFDDIMGHVDLRKGSTAVMFKKIASQSRHPNVNCNVMIIGQDVGLFPKEIRNNAQHVFMFGGKKSQATLLKDMQSAYSEKELSDYLQIYGVDHNCLYFNNNNCTPFVTKIK